MYQIWYETSVEMAVFSTKQKAVDYLNIEADKYQDDRYKESGDDVDYPDLREVVIDPVKSARSYDR